MNNLAAHRMPPLGSSRVHQEAVNLISQWITDANDFYIVAAVGHNVCMALPPANPVSGTPNYQWFKQPDLGTVLGTTNNLCFTDAQVSDSGD